ncbi:MAG: hypothetical protein GY810_15085 [Aureispira sp.]|nr:hypothetical protein [Aureispira sp.]
MLVLHNIEIQKLEQQHIPQVKDIFDQQFGQGYLSQKDIEAFLVTPYIGVVSLQEQHVLGVSLSLIDSAKELSLQFLEGPARTWFLQTFKDDAIVALRKHSAIHPDFQRQGFGQDLVSLSNELLEPHVEAILSTVWEEKSGQSMGKIFRHCGFESIKTIPNYWYEDSIKKQYICSLCAAIPCTCSSTIYLKKINS